jgi:hypothetical protein
MSGIVIFIIVLFLLAGIAIYIKMRMGKVLLIAGLVDLAQSGAFDGGTVNTAISTCPQILNCITCDSNNKCTKCMSEYVIASDGSCMADLNFY